MSLNIKNPEAHQMARELAKLTGKNMTTVVIDALRTQLKQYQNPNNPEQHFEELMAIGKRCANHLQHHSTATEHGNLLYDEWGMPA